MLETTLMQESNFLKSVVSSYQKTELKLSFLIPEPNLNDALTDFASDCGNYFTTNTSEPATDCSMSCAGNITEACGGGSRMGIFWNGQKPPPPPVHDLGPPGWAWLGCYTYVT